jgi:hypothetical protein
VMEDWAQAELGLEAAEHRLKIGEHAKGAPQVPASQPVPPLRR